MRGAINVFMAWYLVKQRENFKFTSVPLMTVDYANDSCLQF
jgi:hypothetical protein